MDTSVNAVRFLFMSFGEASQILQATPLIRCLKQQVEGAEISFLTTQPNSRYLETNKNVKQIVVFNGKIKQTARNLKYEHYDYIVDLQGGFRTDRLKRRIGMISFTIETEGFKIWKHINLRRLKHPLRSFVERSFDLVGVFDVRNDNKGMDFFIRDDTVVNHLPDSYILISLHAERLTRQLPENKIIDLCHKINKKIVLAGNKEDNELATRITNKMNGKVINHCGKNIQHIAYMVQQSVAVVSFDSEVMHLSAALNKENISIWGNTVPLWGNKAYMAHKKSVVFGIENLTCRPCSSKGFAYCPKKHFKCMQDIDTDKLANIINQF